MSAPLSKGPELVTFGCRLNAYESEIMRQHAQTAGLDKAVIINTCAVTNEAVRQARQAIRKARREQPAAHIIATGCAVQIDPHAFAAMPEIDLVLGNEEKLEAKSYTAFTADDPMTDEKARVRVADIMAVREAASHTVPGIKDRARAIVQVQNGCDHRCTFCIIPYGRGNSRSVPMDEAVTQVRALVENGYREVVLTGVDMTSYGADLPGAPSLGALVREILTAVPELARLRLSSIDSIEVDATLRRLIAGEERLMPHLHLSLQAGDNLILKRMKRRHTREDAIRFCEEVRSTRPDIVFGADFIAGFPTETDAMFENTLRLIDECGLTWLHVFPFSPRPGTPAARMPQLDGAIIKARAARLRAKGEAAIRAHLDAGLGATQAILMETPERGRTRQFAPVRLHSAGVQSGDVIAAHLMTHDGHQFEARCA